MLARTSSHELAEWQAYEREYGPLGPERGDWQAALLAHTLVMVMSGKKGRKFKLADFVLRWGRRRRQTGAQQLAILQAFAARQNARVQKG